jgi:DNA polymerase-3 subunit delta'
MMDDNWGLLGNEWAVNLLRRHIQQDTVRNAYLLTGPAGVGRRSLSLRFFQALNCPEPTAPGEACRICRTCNQIMAMQYPDLSVLQSEREGAMLKVEQVRSIQHALSLKSYQGKYRLALFLRFHEANPNAANALLKTLEEAPPHVILVLTADDPGQLLPTITSRCELLRLRSLPVEAVQTYLESCGKEPEEARLLAHLSNGRPGYALRLGEDPGRLQQRAQWLDDLRQLLPSNRRQRFAYADKVSREKDVTRQVLETWGSFWRDVMLSSCGSRLEFTNIDRTGEIENLGKILNLAQSRRLVEGIKTSLESLERNVNSRLLLEVMLLDWPVVKPVGM